MRKHPAQPKIKKCPALGSTRSACRRKNHWTKVCSNKKDKKRKICQQPRKYQDKKKRSNRIYSVNSDQRDLNELYERVEQMSFNVIQQQKDTRTEHFADMQNQTSQQTRYPHIKTKVDTGAKGNTLLCVNSIECSPKDSLGQSLPGATQEERTILTA